MPETPPAARRLVLASTSPYRAELLRRLGLPFETARPSFDETPLPGETPEASALRLAIGKARSVAAQFSGALVIGSDQVAFGAGRRLDKPGGHDAAVRQLEALSGQCAEFHTAVALIDAPKDGVQARVVGCKVHFRSLDRARIEAYLCREQPYDCAGSAKAEGLGIALIARIETDDPTSLIGLPLIALTEMLERAGMPVV